MKLHNNLVHLTAIATLAFALPASAQLLGGSGGGALGGTLSTGPLNGGLQGGAMGNGEFGGGVTQSAGGVRDTTAGAAGSARATVQDKAGRTRDAAGTAAGKTRAAAGNAANRVRNAPQGSFEGNLTGGVSTAVTRTSASDAPAEGANPAETTTTPGNDKGLELGSAAGGNASAERNDGRADGSISAQGNGRASRDGVSADSNVSGNARADRNAPAAETPAPQQ